MGRVALFFAIFPKEMYLGPLGQPKTVRARIASDARHASDTAPPIRVGARAGPHPAYVGAHVQFGAALSRNP